MKIFSHRPAQSTLRQEPFGLRMILPPIAIIGLLWLPFGFAMIGLIEEWDLLGLFSIHGTFFYTQLDGPLAAHALRPLMPFSFALAHTISPDSFNGWHLLMMAALFLKSISLSWLGWRATNSRAAGVLAGALAVVYPADTMQLSFRSIHINVAEALALAACVLALLAFSSSRRSQSLVLALFATAMLLFAALIYEVSLILAAMPAAVLFARHGFSVTVSREGWITVACWVAAPFAYMLYVIWVNPQIASYQGSVTGDAAGLRHALDVWTDLFEVGAMRALFGGWIDAASILRMTFENYTYLVSATVLIMLCCCAASIRVQSYATVPPVKAEVLRMLPRIASVGLILLLLGFLPFMTSPWHLAISQRTYLWATPGAVFVWVAVLLAVSCIARPLAMAIGAFLLLLGMAAQLFQFHHYVSLSERQRTVLRAVVENFDNDQPARKVVVLDGTSQMGHTWMLGSGQLQHPLSYMFGEAISRFEICRLPSLEWQQHDIFRRAGRCSPDAQGGWTFTGAPSAEFGSGLRSEPPPPMHINESMLTIAQIAPDGTAISQGGTTSRADALKSGTDTIARRYRGVLEKRKFSFVKPMFKDQFASPSFRFDFGDWWSLEEVVMGSGWREAEWSRLGLRHVSSAWIVAPVATIYFHLEPVSTPYRLTGSFDAFANDAVRASMKIQVNGHLVDLAWESEGRFVAEVPSGVLFRGRNEFRFDTVPDMNYAGLSARLDKIALVPLILELMRN